MVKGISCVRDSLGQKFINERRAFLSIRTTDLSQQGTIKSMNVPISAKSIEESKALFKETQLKQKQIYKGQLLEFTTQSTQNLQHSAQQQQQQQQLQQLQEQVDDFSSPPKHHHIHDPIYKNENKRIGSRKPSMSSSSIPAPKPHIQNSIHVYAQENFPQELPKQLPYSNSSQQRKQQNQQQVHHSAHTLHKSTSHQQRLQGQKHRKLQLPQQHQEQSSTEQLSNNQSQPQSHHYQQQLQRQHQDHNRQNSLSSLEPKYHNFVNFSSSSVQQQKTPHHIHQTNPKNIGMQYRLDASSLSVGFSQSGCSAQPRSKHAVGTSTASAIVPHGSASSVSLYSNNSTRTNNNNNPNWNSSYSQSFSASKDSKNSHPPHLRNTNTSNNPAKKLFAVPKTPDRPTEKRNALSEIKTPPMVKNCLSQKKSTNPHTAAAKIMKGFGKTVAEDGTIMTNVAHLFSKPGVEFEVLFKSFTFFFATLDEPLLERQIDTLGAV